MPSLPIRNVSEFVAHEIGVGYGVDVRGIICGLPISYSSTKNPRHVSTTLPEIVCVIFALEGLTDNIDSTSGYLRVQASRYQYLCAILGFVHFELNQ